MHAIEVRDLRKSFVTRQKSAGLRGSLRALLRPEPREALAVRGISFTMEPGELLGFIGPNGAGKSTTIKMLWPTRTILLSRPRIAHTIARPLPFAAPVYGPARLVCLARPGCLPGLALDPAGLAALATLVYRRAEGWLSINETSKLILLTLIPAAVTPRSPPAARRAGRLPSGRPCGGAGCGCGA